MMVPRESCRGGKVRDLDSWILHEHRDADFDGSAFVFWRSGAAGFEEGEFR